MRRLRAAPICPKGRRWLSGVAAAGLLAIGVVGCAFEPPQDDSGNEAEATSPWTPHPHLDDVYSVAAAPEGGAWVGTSSAGLVRWRPDGTFTRHPATGPLAGELLSSVAVSADGAVWVAVGPSPPLPAGRA